MTWGFRSNEQHVAVFRCYDLTKVYVEAVGEHERSAFFQVRLNFVFVYGRLSLIRHKDLYYICFASSVCNRQYFKAIVLRCFKGLPFTQADDNVQTAVSQILRLCMALATVTDDGNCFSFKYAKLCIFFIIRCHWHDLIPPYIWEPFIMSGCSGSSAE
ncbi:hypothetical protein D1872_235860 [compost metagenome]